MTERMPKEGHFQSAGIDNATGARWIHVTPQMARAHPQGRLGLILWAIVVINLGVGVLRTYYGVTITLLILPFALTNFAVALALALRAPMATLLVLVQVIAGIVLSLFVAPLPPDLLAMQAALGLGVLIYLFEGDRPNLIYRHRYRAYSDLDGGAKE